MKRCTEEERILEISEEIYYVIKGDKLSNIFLKGGEKE